MSTNENIFCVSTNIFIHKNFAFHWIRYSFNMAIHFCLFFGILVFGTAHITFSGHIICNINTKNLTVITNEINQFTKFKWSNKFLFLSCKALFLIHQILRMNYDFDEFDVRYLAKNRICAKTVPHDFFFIVKLSICVCWFLFTSRQFLVDF